MFGDWQGVRDRPAMRALVGSNTSDDTDSVIGHALLLGKCYGPKGAKG